MKRILTLLQWLLLFVLAIVILIVFSPICFIIGVISKFWRKKVGQGLDDFTENLAAVTYTLDLLGNVTLFDWLWFVWKKKDGYKFGQKGETISYVLWKNVKQKTITKIGLYLYSTINFFDEGHFEIFEK
ncbi:hypothetical protein J2810_004640 [Chryseobacterium rhizosphaerae]|uniref:hypothetical protein n=1 Tax=Chryseobacterium rhizosphaerae TaxID=395937 RepID=UPI0028609356|nr:hypothetical protein [Chryseobacterium rhizosphaerae]MDR6548550.1 hypothetical protein [Chryseobacterium rhizosphaerae]